MPTVTYRTAGQYDYAAEASVAHDGTYEVRGGTYVTRPARAGRLADAQRQRLAAAVAALSPATHPAPAGAEGFFSEVVVGEGPGAVRVAWWGPEPPADPALAEALAVLRAV